MKKSISSPAMINRFSPSTQICTKKPKESVLRFYWILLGLISYSTAYSTIETPVEVGYFNAKEGKAQFIDMTNLVGNNYRVDEAYQQNVLIGLGAFKDSFNDWRLGVLINYFNTTQITGLIQEENLFS